MISKSSIVILSCLFAFTGFVIQLGIVLILGFGSRLDFVQPVAFSLIGLFLAASLSSHLASPHLCKPSATSTWSIFLGALIGWIALWAQVLFGSSVEYFRNIHVSGAFVDYIIKPTFWVMFLGTIPSLLIGGLFGYIVWRKSHPKFP